MNGELTLTAGAQELAAQYNVDVAALSQQVEGSVRWQKTDMMNYLVSAGIIDPTTASNMAADPVAPVEPVASPLPAPEMAVAAVGDRASAEVVPGPMHVSTIGTDPIISEMLTLETPAQAVVSAGPAISNADINFINEFDALLDTPDALASKPLHSNESGAVASAHYDGPTTQVFEKQVSDAVAAYAKAPKGSVVRVPWNQRALAVALTKTTDWAISENVYDKTTCNFTLVVMKVN